MEKFYGIYLATQFTIPWEPTTFISRGVTHILGVQNLHFSWFWGPRVDVTINKPTIQPPKNPFVCPREDIYTSNPTVRMRLDWNPKNPIPGRGLDS